MECSLFASRRLQPNDNKATKQKNEGREKLQRSGVSNLDEPGPLQVVSSAPPARIAIRCACVEEGVHPRQQPLLGEMMHGASTAWHEHIYPRPTNRTHSGAEAVSRCCLSYVLRTWTLFRKIRRSPGLLEEEDGETAGQQSVTRRRLPSFRPCPIPIASAINHSACCVHSI